MKKLTTTHYVLIGVAVLALLLVFWFVGTYNSLIKLNNAVEGQWAQVENQYQRRADLIPNLVSTVKGFAKQELTIFTEVTKLRSQWSDASTRSEKIAAANAMDSGLSRLLLVAENYPQLKSNENFLALQAQLEGTENRVAVERQRYNEQVVSFNNKIQTVPSVFVAKMFDYEKKDYFQVEEGKEAVPVVEF